MWDGERVYDSVCASLEGLRSTANADPKLLQYANGSAVSNEWVVDRRYATFLDWHVDSEFKRSIHQSSRIYRGGPTMQKYSYVL